MTQPLQLEPSTNRDIAQILFPKHAHTKLALSVAEFFAEEHRPGGGVTANHPHFDTATLQRFVEFLITKKGYN